MIVSTGKIREGMSMAKAIQAAQDLAKSLTPQRIQLFRKKGFKLPPNTVVVSRPSRWGNPYKLAEFSGSPTRQAELAVACFSQMVDTNRDFRILAKEELRGKNLACWCKPGQPCHADVLLEIANQ